MVANENYKDPNLQRPMSVFWGGMRSHSNFGKKGSKVVNKYWQKIVSKEYCVSLELQSAHLKVDKKGLW